MKVAIVMNDFNAGGAERLVKDLANQLIETHSVEPIVIVANEKGELKPEFEDENIPYKSLGIRVGVTTIPEGALKLKMVLQELEPDIIHSHLAYPDLISRTCCVLQSIPHISTYHSVRENRSFLKNIVELATWRLSDEIICVSEGVKNSYNRSKKMNVVHNAIDVGKFNKRVYNSDINSGFPHSTDDTVFVNIGRCIDVKNQDLIIEAVKKASFDDIYLYILGDGPLLDELDNKISKLDLNDNITLTGYVEDVTPYLAIADAFISSSEMEGLPTSHVEAMAAELPIISTEIPGVTEVVKDGYNGYLCTPNDVNQLSRKIEDMIMEDPQYMGKNGYELAKSKFSLETLIVEHLKSYEKLSKSVHK